MMLKPITGLLLILVPVALQRNLFSPAKASRIRLPPPTHREHLARLMAARRCASLVYFYFVSGAFYTSPHFSSTGIRAGGRFLVVGTVIGVLDLGLFPILGNA